MAKQDKLKNVSIWTEPLLKILEGHADMIHETRDFPGVGKIPAAKDLQKLEKMIKLGPGTVTPVAAGAAVGVVAVVVCVAVAARPGALRSEEMLRAKLLDVYGPRERERLQAAIALVKKNPSMMKAALGVTPRALGADFMKRLDRVNKALR